MKYPWMVNFLRSLILVALVGGAVAAPAQAGPERTQAVSNDAAGRVNAAVLPAATIADRGAAGDINIAAKPAESGADLVIRSGDLLQFSMYGVPDMVRDVRVSTSGAISLPMIGDVQVAGFTTARAEKSIEQKYVADGFFKNPQVTVLAKEFSTQGISVLGEVQKPGIYPLLGAHTVLDAVSAAGGVTPKAGNQALLRHRDNSAVVTIPLTTDAAAMRDNTVLIPGDTVMVAKAGIVYVVGDVRMPGGFVMNNNHMTVLQAIAMAQGTTGTASLNGARLIRRTGEGPQEIPIPLKKIFAAKEPDLQLNDDDILFVPGSTTKSAAKRSLEAIVEAATGIAVYRPY